MQPTILAITLVIMAVTLVLILRAILPTTGPEPDADAPKMRTRLIWVMIVVRSDLVGHFSSGMATHTRRR